MAEAPALPGGGAALAAAHRTAVVLTAAFMGAVILYLVVAEVLAALRAPFEGMVRLEQMDLVRTVGAVAAIVVVFVASAVRRRQLSTPLATGESAPARLTTMTLLCAALYEALAVSGFVLFVLAGRRRDLYLFAGVALLLFAVHFPRRAQWDEWGRALRVARPD